MMMIMKLTEVEEKVNGSEIDIFHKYILIQVY